MAKLLVLDFDGTMTDAEAEGVPFRGGYLEDLAALVDQPLAEVEALASRLEAEIAADAGRYGWVYGGRIVAPASVDPYLRIMPVARRLLDHYGAFQVEAERSRLLDAILYKYNYQKTRLAFRPGARDFLLSLGEVPALHPWVVTNSHTDPVRGKIQALGQTEDGGNPLAWLLERVKGRARKYVLDDAYDAVPDTLTLPGLARPIFLRRRAYGETLDALRQAAGVSWRDVAVVGDIFELDLALPLALGARVALMANAHTPNYERAFLLAHPRGVVLTALNEVLPWVMAG